MENSGNGADRVQRDDSENQDRGDNDYHRKLSLDIEDVDIASDRDDKGEVDGLATDGDRDDDNEGEDRDEDDEDDYEPPFGFHNDDLPRTNKGLTNLARLHHATFQHALAMLEIDDKKCHQLCLQMLAEPYLPHQVRVQSLCLIAHTIDGYGQGWYDRAVIWVDKAKSFCAKLLQNTEDNADDHRAMQKLDAMVDKTYARLKGELETDLLAGWDKDPEEDDWRETTRNLAVKEYQLADEDELADLREMSGVGSAAPAHAADKIDPVSRTFDEPKGPLSPVSDADIV